MKTFFPDLPLNSGFYRMIEVTAPKNSVVSAEWPVAVTGFLMPFEKIMNSIFEMWSQIMPERAIACAFNLEYLLAGVATRANRKSRSSCSTSGFRGMGWAQRQGRRRRDDCLLWNRPDVAAERR